MEKSTASFQQLGATSKQLVRRLATIGENRLELRTVEVQEERGRGCKPFSKAHNSPAHSGRSSAPGPNCSRSFRKKPPGIAGT